MTHFDQEVRRALRELADAGRPVDLSRAALAGARRRRRARLGATAVSAAVALAIALSVGLVTAPGPEPTSSPATSATTPPADLDLAGRIVVTSYRHGSDRYVLDPVAGEYRPAADFAQPDFSPDLRWRAWLAVAPSDSGGPVVSIEPTGSPDDRRTVSLPERPGSAPLTLSWSPDSRRLAVISEGDPGLRSVDLVEVDEADSTELELEFPAGRSGWDGYAALGPHPAAQWLDAEHLAVPTIEARGIQTGDSVGRLPDVFTTDTAGPGYPPPTSFVIYSVAVFDLTGALVDELPINTDDIDATDEPHAGMIWTPTGLGRDGRQVMFRGPEPNVFELATVDVRTDSGPYRSVTVELPLTEDENQLPGWLAGWLPDDTLLVQPPIPIAQAESGAPRVLVVDLRTGAVRDVPDLVTELWPDAPVPAGATELTVADAGPLPPTAAHLAFAP